MRQIIADRRHFACMCKRLNDNKPYEKKVLFRRSMLVRVECFNLQGTIQQQAYYQPYVTYLFPCFVSYP